MTALFVRINSHFNEKLILAKRRMGIMRKIFTLFIAIIFIFVLTACGSANGSKNSATPPSSSGSSISDELNKNGIKSNVEVTAEQAEQAALTHAGVTSAEAKFKRTELDFDDGVYKYEVDFYVGITEYEYEIDAKTGNVISFDKDID